MAEKNELSTRGDGISVYSRVNTETQAFTIGAASFSPGLYPHWGILRVAQVGEAFLLTDRSFTGKPFASGGIDGYFKGVPSQLLREMQFKQPLVHVVDIGGGKDSASVKEIIQIFPRVTATNIDLVLDYETREGHLTEKPGSALELPLENETADLVYSHQVFPFLKPINGVDRPLLAIEEVVRILKPGGTAVIDDGHFSDPMNSPRLKSLDHLPVEITLGDKSYGQRFLIMHKPAS